jgi:hypothetical protein
MVERPEHYMYSDYRGHAFLADWLADRKSMAPARPSDWDGTSRVLAEFVGSELEPSVATVLAAGPGHHQAMTLPLLDAMIVRDIGGEGTAEAAAWLDLFHRKFEATKRLRSEYGRDLRGQGDHVEPRAYPRLAYLLSAGDGLARNLRRLNAVLKLNDLALSYPPATMDRCARLCLAFAIEAELVATQALCVRVGVRWPVAGESGSSR